MSQRQYKREAQVIFGKNGTGLLVENLRIQYEVVKDIQPSPNTANIKIFNLNDQHMAQVRNEFTEVLLNAGYEGGLRLIFRGNIKHAYKYREGNDWILEVDAADGDRDFRTAVINETMAAGTTDQQLLDRCVGSFQHGTKKGHVDGISRTGRLRGKVVSGNTRNILNTLAEQNDCNWSIQDGQLQIVPVDGVLPSQAIVVNSETGMLGAPEQDDKGIKVKSQMNPLYQINGRIQLDNNSIKKKKKSTEEIAETGTKESGEPVRLDPDGIYKIIKLTQKGDTHGPDWFSEKVCIALGSTPKKAK